jgi:cystathionine gamma-synthase/cystathionine beta-lyase
MTTNVATLAAQLGVNSDPRTGAVTAPIYQTATFRHPGIGRSTGFDYTRSNNPTRQVLEQGMAQLEGGSRGFAYASGMAAIASFLLLFRHGDHIVVTEDLYGGSYRLFEKVFREYGLAFHYVDTSDTRAVAAALLPNTRALFVESLTNPMLKVADVSALAALCRERGILCVVDNTFLTPYLFRPLDHGADVTLYSGSKYLAGHNDTICGLTVVKDAALGERIYFHQNAVGAALSPLDSWLTIRGLKTLAVRLDRQQENAHVLAQWLQRHSRIRAVHYPGLPSHAGHELLKRQARGCGAMISFEVVDAAMVEPLLSRIKLISFAESLGGVETLITLPEVQTHADFEPEKRARFGINSALLRLSVGIEDVNDLIADLAQAMEP